MNVKALSLGILLSMTITPALAETWDIDSQHSSAQFKIQHMMASRVNGTITGVKGTVDYDGKHVTGLKLTAELDPKTINTNEPDRDKHLRSADFFDVDKYPAMSFKSKRVVKEANGQYKLIGDLTMHGVTKEVALNLEQPTPPAKDMKGIERVGASASTKIHRKDFGITWNKQLDNGGVVLGEDVDISLDVELKKQQKTATSEQTKKSG